MPRHATPRLKCSGVKKMLTKRNAGSLQLFAESIRMYVCLWCGSLHGYSFQNVLWFNIAFFLK